MRIIYMTGDIFDCAEAGFCHGCNAFGVMGSGLARLVKQRAGYAFAAYHDEYTTRGLKLGTIVWAEGPKLIANCITQDDFGNDKSRVYVSYDAIRSCVAEINRECVKRGIAAFAFPLIGAGLANGSWKTISAIIEQESTAFQPVVYTLDGVIPTS